jgi:predicted site-specific integrase-resolvase
MPWYKPKGGAKHGGVSERTFRAWFKQGLVHCRLPSGLVLVHTDDIDAFIRKYQVNVNEVDEVVDEIMKDFDGAGPQS